MKADIDKIIKHLAESFLNAFKGCLMSDKGINQKVGINTLEDSTLAKTSKSRYIDKDNDYIAELIVNDYIKYIESGRRKGAKMPPVLPILKWCKKNNIPTDNGTIFKIRRAISKNGIKARPIFDTVWEDMDSQIESIYFDKIYESIIIDLTKYFNNGNNK